MSSDPVTFVIVFFFSFFLCQILEVEGMSVPDEVSCMLQMVSEYLKEPCPITSLSGSQGPTGGEGVKHAHGDDAAGKARRQPNQVRTEGLPQVLNANCA